MASRSLEGVRGSHAFSRLITLKPRVHVATRYPQSWLITSFSLANFAAARASFVSDSVARLLRYVNVFGEGRSEDGWNCAGTDIFAMAAGRMEDNAQLPFRPLEMKDLAARLDTEISSVIARDRCMQSLLMFQQW